MKKFMFLTLVVSVMAFCFSCGDEQVQESTNNGQTERPNTEDNRPKITDIPNAPVQPPLVEWDYMWGCGPTFWTLDIVKFKNPEYKNHVMARYNISTDSTYAITKFLITTHRPYGHAEEIPAWADLKEDYLLCHWRWQASFCKANRRIAERDYFLLYNTNEYKRHGADSSVIRKFINSVVVLQDTWDMLPNSFGGDVLYDITEDVMRYKTLVLDSDPLLEHYVVNVHTLFKYMNQTCDAIDSCYILYSPIGGHHLVDCELRYLRDELNYPIGDDEVIYTTMYDKYDSLFGMITTMLDTIIEQGKLEEFIEYDRQHGNDVWYPRFYECMIAC